MAVTITGPAGPVNTGTLQTATWGGVTKPVHVATRSDWFGLYVTTATDSEPSLWRQTDGSAAGSSTLFLPPNLPNTSYEFRLFSGHTNAKLATSAAFTVNVTGSPPLISAPSTASANDTITITWSGVVDPRSTDFILLVDAALQPGPPLPAAIARVLTTGTAAGSVPLYIPNATPAGSYNAYLYRDAIPEYGLREVWLAGPASVLVSRANVATIASPGDQLAGTLVAAQWTNIVSPAPSTQDWVGLFALGAPAAAPLGNRYLNGTASGSLPFVIPGYLPTASYELRLYSGTDQSLLATSAAFTVTAVP